MLTGSVPFDGETSVSVALKHLREAPKSMRQQNSGISKALDEVVMRALCKDPAKRYQSAAEFAGDLRRAIAKPQGGFVKYPKSPEQLEQERQERRRRRERDQRRLRIAVTVTVAATVLLALTGAGMAGFLAVSIKPYIARRFATWGHVWEDIYDTGYQQARAMSAAASGGLFGKGAGAGWLKDIVAANTDMVFAVICEELGLIIAICMVLAVLALAFFALRSARHGRTAYFAIASCGAMAMLMVQMGLNVFGSLDILPFTGVTFPFVSRGGSSLLSCWMLMAFLKGADNRRDASFVVRPAEADLPPLSAEDAYYEGDGA
jgi:hypothetical protein